MTAPLYGTFNRATGRSTQVVRDSETGLPLIIHGQNTRPILEANARQRSTHDPTVRREVVHVARIPINIWRQLLRTGVAKDERALNAWLNERDNRVFRVDDERKL